MRSRGGRWKMALKRNRDSSSDTRGSNEEWVMTWTNQEVGWLRTEKGQIPTSSSV